MHYRARDRHPLSLSSRETRTPISNQRVIPLWQCHDEIMSICNTSGPLQIGVCE